jgi:sugar lactone lactonase YvrE
MRACIIGLALGIVGLCSQPGWAEESLASKAAGQIFRVVAAFAAPAESAAEVAEPKLSDIDERATHQQSEIIQIKQGDDDTMKVSAFCLDAQGNILAACGDGPGEIRVINPAGKLVSSWKIDVKPEAINTAPDGTILVGGQGQLFRFAADGSLLKQVESPHAIDLKEQREELRSQAKQALKQQSNSLEARIESLESIIAQLNEQKEKGELSADHQRLLDMLPKQIEQFKELQKKQGNKPEPQLDEKQIEQQVSSLAQYKLRISSITADDKHIYLATPAIKGHGYQLWRMNGEFAEPTVLVTNLVGCCGQMDVQVGSAGLYVAENARHRVVRYDTDGKQSATWGGRDRTGDNGFTSCCNPMNVCFNKQGDVFTAESNTGRIKQFDADGNFKAFVGDIKLVPGCKNVSIAVSPDEQRVYMLDLTRNHIVVMQRKEAGKTAAVAPATSAN